MEDKSIIVTCDGESKSYGLEKAGWGTPKPDLSQNDPNAADYVNNRTHYTEWTDSAISHLEVTGQAGNTYGYTKTVPPAAKVVKGGEYYFYIDGELVSSGLYTSYVAFQDSLKDALIAAGVANTFTTYSPKTDRKTGWYSLSVSFTALRDFTLVCGYKYPTFVKTLDERYIPDNIPKIQSATVGQTIVVSEIDDDGKPIAWEPAIASFVAHQPLAIITFTDPDDSAEAGLMEEGTCDKTLPELVTEVFGLANHPNINADTRRILETAPIDIIITRDGDEVIMRPIEVWYSINYALSFYLVEYRSDGSLNMWLVRYYDDSSAAPSISYRGTLTSS